MHSIYMILFSPLAEAHGSEVLVVNKTREWMLVQGSRNGSVFWKTSWKQADNAVPGLASGPASLGCPC